MILAIVRAKISLPPPAAAWTDELDRTIGFPVRSRKFRNGRPAVGGERRETDATEITRRLLKYDEVRRNAWLGLLLIF
jgi:hypothetical protein